MGVKTFLSDHIPGYNSLVKPWHFTQAVFANLRYRRPAKHLTVIAVTGTNGKTSTCFMIWKMLNSAGHKTGLLTTVGWGIDHIEPQIEHMTTESVAKLNRRIRTIADQGAEYLVLEVTSHALSQSRILGIPISIAVETNLTHEHLDYHKTFENYRAAKCKLFQKAQYGIVNADDKSAVHFISAVLPKNYATKISTHGYAAHPDKFQHKEQDYYTTYGIHRGILRASDIKLSPSGVHYTCINKLNNFSVSLQIPGTFTVYNSLAAIAVGLRLGLSISEIQNGLYELESVEGRMNRLDCGQPFDVIVDYAHTPDALQKVFESVGIDFSKPSKLPKSPKSSTSQKLPSGRIISVHGGAGRRDESTRAERGEILARGSDIVIITEDDSRDEDPQSIANMFAKGCEQQGMKLIKNADHPDSVASGSLIIELDRQKAIQLACKLAAADARNGLRDLVLILGKGHEKTILRADGPHPFEDIKVTTKILQKLYPTTSETSTQNHPSFASSNPHPKSYHSSSPTNHQKASH